MSFPGVTQPATVSVNCDGDDRRDAILVLDDKRLTRAIGSHMAPILADWIEIAGAVYVADRSIHRPAPGTGGTSWGRTIGLRIGVRAIDRWRDPEIQGRLSSVLHSLTDDEWAIEFTARSAPIRSSEAEPMLFETRPRGDAVCLYSGGLDSLLGFVADLDSGLRPVPLAVQSNTRQAPSQREAPRAILKASGVDISPLVLPLHLRTSGQLERSSRTRGFVFQAIGLAVAAMAELEELRIYENGIGAISLPYDESQVGSQATLATHPTTTAAMGQLATLAFGRGLRVINPNIFRTKGEMCDSTRPLYAEYVDASPSCDTAFTRRESGPDHCGHCTSCILRRVSLIGSEVGELLRHDQYRFDIFGRQHHGCGPKELGAGEHHIHLMLRQAGTMHRHLQEPDPWHSLTLTYPRLDSAVRAVAETNGGVLQCRSQALSMYRRYVDELCSIGLPNIGWYMGST